MEQLQDEANPRTYAPISLPPLPDRPLFSVLIRNYNYARYVGIALESVLQQTYPNFEIIVCDDGSTDRSREIIQDYAEKEPRITLVTQENGGAVSSANSAYAHSRGELIALLDADDLFKPSKLEKALAAFRSHPRCGIYVHSVQPVSETGELFEPPFPAHLGTRHGWVGPTKLREGGCAVLPPTSGITLRRKVASLLYPIPRQIKYREDYYLASTAELFTEITMDSECLTDYRCHETNRSRMRASRPRGHFFVFNPKVQETWVEALEVLLPLQEDCLRRIYGSEVARMLRLEDHPDYWRILLRVRALRGKQGAAFRPFTVKEMIAHIQRPAEKWFWRAIGLMPAPLASRAVPLLRSPSFVRRVIQALARPFIKR